ncbi:MAG: type II secretion system GspH family protein [Spirochaetes bacterium]|nr:type II secretion system GspH family protein [Spirochaetota bacterium]
MIRKNRKGFSIIEILIAISVLSIALLGIISGVSAGVVAIAGNKNISKAMIIAKSQLNDFISDNMRGLDLSDEAIEEYPGFTYSREIKRFEHELLGPLDADIVKITIKWEERGRKKEYVISYIYPLNIR